MQESEICKLSLSLSHKMATFLWNSVLGAIFAINCWFVSFCENVLCRLNYAGKSTLIEQNFIGQPVCWCIFLPFLTLIDKIKKWNNFIIKLYKKRMYRLWSFSVSLQRPFNGNYLGDWTFLNGQKKYKKYFYIIMW